MKFHPNRKNDMEKEPDLNRALNILSLEDSPPDFKIISELLLAAGFDFKMNRVENEHDFVSALTSVKYDVILADFNLPQYDAFEALKKAIEICPEIPFICVSGSIGEEAAIELIKQGAVDYILKDKPHKLPFAVKRALLEAEEKKERKQAEESLRISEAKYRGLFEANKDGISIFYVNPDESLSNFVEMNNASYEMLGYTREEFKNLSTADLEVYQNEDTLEGRKQQIFENGFAAIETKVKHKNGKMIDVEIRAIPIQYNNRVALMNIIRDITEQKRAEEELIAAKEKAEESDRLKSAFLANMSHEIRTPMNGILGFANLLKEPDLTGEEQQKYIGIIEKSGVRMLTIINDIISISKIESGLMEVNWQESNINEQIEYVYTFFKPEVEEKGMQFSFKNSLPLEDAIIKTDREKVYAILTNLVKNAVKYTEKGSIEFGYNKKSKYLEFYVKDTGIGVPKDRQEAIFERFVQADITDIMARQGAGLGLAISKAYVKMLGGNIWVESEVGEGSTFYFTLPFLSETMKEGIVKSEVLTPAEVVPIKKLKILIAEDNEPSEMLLSIAVKKFGNEITSVKTGTEAVAICLNNPNIDLVLMDILMPEMNGYEATRQIRKFNKDIIIIAQTAYALEGDKEKAIAAGCNDYIAKPTKANELKQIIIKYAK